MTSGRRTSSSDISGLVNMKAMLTLGRKACESPVNFDGGRWLILTKVERPDNSAFVHSDVEKDVGFGYDNSSLHKNIEIE